MQLSQFSIARDKFSLFIKNRMILTFKYILIESLIYLTVL